MRPLFERASDFLTIERADVAPAPVAERIESFDEFEPNMCSGGAVRQVAHSMQCGTPNCHTCCPSNNEIPDRNVMVLRDQWQAAARNLHLANNFAKMTGRICPAPCADSGTHYLRNAPVDAFLRQSASPTRGLPQCRRARSWLNEVTPVSNT